MEELIGGTIEMDTQHSGPGTLQSWDDVEVILRWQLQQEPGFLVLSRGDNYVQAAGGHDRYAVEWRETNGDSYRHWVAGRATAPGRVVPIDGGAVSAVFVRRIDSGVQR